MKHNYLRDTASHHGLHPPAWAVNGHIHTIIASQLKVAANEKIVRTEISTPDNDFIELDLLYAEQPRGVMALFHGLEGSSERVYIRSLMDKLYRNGFSSVAMNFRGCGSRMNNARRFYHSGETDDYNTLFSWIGETMPGLPVLATGFSLGANALIKYLAEYTDTTPVSKAVAVSPPYDLKEGSLAMQRGFNKIYELRFLRTLRRKLRKKRGLYPGLPEFTGNTLYDFDDQITAPVHGFRDAEDYYNSCSSGLFLPQIRVPLLIVHSIQDPICPLEYAPFKEIEANPALQSCFTQEGGHVGFLHKYGDWLNSRILKWVVADT